MSKNEAHGIFATYFWPNAFESDHLIFMVHFTLGSIFEAANMLPFSTGTKTALQTSHDVTCFH
jgi:hypothetical protein